MSDKSVLNVETNFSDDTFWEFGGHLIGQNCGVHRVKIMSFGVFNRVKFRTDHSQKPVHRVLTLSRSQHHLSIYFRTDIVDSLKDSCCINFPAYISNIRSIFGRNKLHTKEERFNPIDKISSKSVGKHLVSLASWSCQYIVVDGQIEEAPEVVDRRRDRVPQSQEFLHEDRHQIYR